MLTKLIFLATAFLSSNGAYIVNKVQQIAPGLTHTHIVSSDSRAGGPLNAHILRADLDGFELRPVLALGQIVGQETTSSMVKRHGALAGVNGGYSFSNNPWSIYHGDPRGFLALNGQVLSEPNAGAWSVRIQSGVDGRQSFDLVQPQLHVRVHIESGIEMLCAGVNRERRDEECVVYTPAWNRNTLADRSGVEVVVAGGRIKAVRDGLPGALIPSDGVVVSARGALAQRLRLVDVGVLADVSFELRDSSTAETLALVDHAYVSAGPVLVRGGKAMQSYPGDHWFHQADFTDVRHPRTALAWNDRELLLVTVDGRQKDHSVGFTLAEFASFLVLQGVEVAYNMDGGGSTTMAIAGDVVNRFSDIWGGSLGEAAIERRRCDALLLFQNTDTQSPPQ